MKIAYIIPSLANRGPIIVCKDLVTVMVNHGHECIVFYFDDIVELQFSCITQKIFFLHSIDFSSFDIVHSHGLRPDLYIFIHKPLNCHSLCVSTIHSFIIEDLSSQYNKYLASIIGRLWFLFLKRHNKIVVLSNIALNYYKKWFSLSRLNVVYNTRILEKKTLTSKEEKEFLNFKKENIILGVNALLTPIKGIDLIIKSLPFLKDHINLWIVGNGKSMSELQELTHKLNLEKRVYFAGYRKDAFRYLPYYDISVISSRSEGFGLSLIEAVIHKRKVICSNIPIFKEIFSDKEVSFFELENISSFTKSVEETLASDNSENAFQRYQENYSSERFYKNYITVYTH